VSSSVPYGAPGYPAGNLPTPFVRCSACSHVVFPAGEVVVGSCATGTREPGQARNGAAFIGIVCVPQIAWPLPQPSGTSPQPYMSRFCSECRPKSRHDRRSEGCVAFLHRMPPEIATHLVGEEATMGHAVRFLW